jgi:hypothetical protein
MKRKSFNINASANFEQGKAGRDFAASKEEKEIQDLINKCEVTLALFNKQFADELLIGSLQKRLCDFELQKARNKNAPVPDISKIEKDMVVLILAKNINMAAKLVLKNNPKLIDLIMEGIR